MPNLSQLANPQWQQPRNQGSTRSQMQMPSPFGASAQTAPYQAQWVPNTPWSPTPTASLPTGDTSGFRRGDWNKLRGSFGGMGSFFGRGTPYAGVPGSQMRDAKSAYKDMWGQWKDAVGSRDLGAINNVWQQAMPNSGTTPLSILQDAQSARMAPPTQAWNDWYEALPQSTKTNPFFTGQQTYFDDPTGYMNWFNDYTSGPGWGGDYTPDEWWKDPNWNAFQG